jgi:hypothetical protein
VQHYWLSKALLAPKPSVDQPFTQPGGSHFIAGGISGLAAAVALYPFDFVRMTTTKGGSHFAASTIPYMSMYIGENQTSLAEPSAKTASYQMPGVYFLNPGRANEIESDEPQPFSSKVAWALGAASCASAIEFPFDRSKHQMLGSMRNAAFAAALRVPLGALLLIGYDQIHARGMERGDTPVIAGCYMFLIAASRECGVGGFQLHPPSNFESKQPLFNIQDARLKRTKRLHRVHVQQNQGRRSPGPIKPPPLRYATRRHFCLRCIIGEITPADSCIIKDACMFGCTAKATTEHKVCNGSLVCVLHAHYGHLTTPTPLV